MPAECRLRFHTRPAPLAHVRVGGQNFPSDQNASLDLPMPLFRLIGFRLVGQTLEQTKIAMLRRLLQDWPRIGVVVYRFP